MSLALAVGVCWYAIGGVLCVDIVEFVKGPHRWSKVI